MFEDHFDTCFTPEEVRTISKRIMEIPPSSPEQEREFHQFFERARKAAELYNLFMFRGMKIIEFDKKLEHITIREQNGESIMIDLR